MRPDHRFVGTSDEVLAALREDLDRDVLGYQIVVDDVSHEVEIGLGGGRKSDLDLLESHFEELDEHRVLAFQVHRIDESLIAVAKIDAAPPRRLGPVSYTHLRAHETGRNLV